MNSRGLKSGVGDIFFIILNIRNMYQNIDMMEKIGLSYR